MRHKCGDGYGDSGRGGYCGGYVKTTTVVGPAVIRIEQLQKIFRAAKDLAVGRQGPNNP